MLKIQNNRIKRLLQFRRMLFIRAMIRMRKRKVNQNQNQNQNQNRNRNRNQNRNKNQRKIQNNIYDDMYIIPTQKINFSRTIIKRINNDDVVFYTSNPCIIKHPYEIDKYIINIRWINYKLDDNSDIKLLYNSFISLNSYFILDKYFNKISEEYFLNNFEYYNNYQILFGIEDTRIFTYLNKIYYIGSTFNKVTYNTSITSAEYHLKNDNDDFRMNTRIITPSFYKYLKVEKNWCFVNYHNQKCFIYQWSPLTICVMDDYDRLNVIESKEIKSPFFKNVRGSTSGILYNNEIWFIVHTAHNREYQHIFAVFDTDMNLLRYTPPFKLNKTKVEYCIGFIIEQHRTILSFSSSDTNIFIATYNNNYIRSLKWINE
jgi:hypothetical protein